MKQDKLVFTVENNGERHELAVGELYKGYAIYVDGEIHYNQEVVNAYGGTRETFDRMMKIFELSGDPVAAEDKNRLSNALLFAVNQQQYKNKCGEGK